MTELAREYGEGLYALAEEEGLEDGLLTELETLLGCFGENPDFLRLLGNMSLSKEERLDIADKALRGQVHPYVLSFLKLLCERGAAYAFPGCAEAYRLLYNKQHGIVEAHVTTSIPLTEEQRARMTEKLRAMSGKQVTLVERIDPSIMGGVVLEMEGKRYDNSVTARLERMRTLLSGRT